MRAFLPLIDFSVLTRRTTPVAFLGFSEITPLVNIVGSYRHGIGIYDMSPAFLPYGLRRRARVSSLAKGADSSAVALTVPPDEITTEFSGFFRDITSMLSGEGTSRRITAELVRGQMPDTTEAAFVGGEPVRSHGHGRLDSPRLHHPDREMDRP